MPEQTLTLSPNFGADVQKLLTDALAAITSGQRPLIVVLNLMPDILALIKDFQT